MTATVVYRIVKRPPSPSIAAPTRSRTTASWPGSRRVRMPCVGSQFAVRYRQAHGVTPRHTLYRD